MAHQIAFRGRRYIPPPVKCWRPTISQHCVVRIENQCQSKLLCQPNLTRCLQNPSFQWSLDFVSNARSEEHTSELQSRVDLVCRLLLEKKKQNEYGAK